MRSVQIKNVPDDTHAVLVRRAAEAGMSLQEYLLAHLISEARQPTLDEVLDRVNDRRGGSVSPAEAVAHLREDRRRDG
ncbi:MAG: hypothetical protein H3C53_04035 [Trueperaceae bacterium]|nr:hypothetical protein [Trueperaceae bacterium]